LDALSSDFLKNMGLACSASAMDPLRADQATEKVAQGFQDMIETKVTEMNQMFPDLFPWKRYIDIPAAVLHNMDEISNNGKQNREKKICTSAIFNKDWVRVVPVVKKESRVKRIFERTTGDNGDKLGHRTIVLTTRGDGRFATKVKDKDGKLIRFKGAHALRSSSIRRARQRLVRLENPRA
jgi:hypothetical protein